jgi:DNA-binding transcriptional LysR family regulator
MELRHLKYFLVLTEELSFTKAAGKLCIAQPPLSRQIRELEKELGTSLFDRNNKRVVLTEAGKYFETQIRELFVQLNTSIRRTKEIGNSVNGEYKIAYVSSTFSGDISKLIKHLSAFFPFVKFRLYEVPTVKQITALEQGKIDLGVVRAPVSSAKIETKVWFRDSFSFIFHPSNTVIKKEKDLIKLRDETFVFFNKDYAPSYYTALIEICASIGFKPQIIHESNNVSSIVQMVSNGLGVSIIPSSVLRNQKNPIVKSIKIQRSRFHTDVLIARPKHAKSIITDEVIKFLFR